MALADPPERRPATSTGVGIVGALSAVGMCVGALGPWARASVINFSGWAGIGFPIVIVAFVALVLQVLHAFVPRRMWQVLSLIIAAVCLIVAVVLAILVSVLSNTGDLVAELIARGAHKDVIAAHPVSLGWAIPVLGISSLLLMLASIAGLFGRFPESAVGRFLKERTSSGPTLPEHSETPELAMPGDSSASTSDDLFNTR